MKIVKKLKELFKKKLNGENNLDAPEGLCPNCWGREEYGGKFYDTVYKENTNLGWISSYYEKKLKHIELKKSGEKLICPACKITYKLLDD